MKMVAFSATCVFMIITYWLVILGFLKKNFFADFCRIEFFFAYVYVQGQRGAREHEASRRLKTELLIQMDGLNKTDDLVFLLAASNLPWCVYFIEISINFCFVIADIRTISRSCCNIMLTM